MMLVRLSRLPHPAAVHPLNLPRQHLQQHQLTIIIIALYLQLTTTCSETNIFVFSICFEDKFYETFSVHPKSINDGDLDTTDYW